MPTLYERVRREQLVERLARLTPDRPARWGRFTAPQMVSHLIESMRMAKGELSVPAKRLLPLLFIVRPLVVHLLPWPKGAPTAPLLLARAPESWAQDVARLRGLIEAVREPALGATLPAHPAFGPMSARDWGVLLYRHVDHHLRQFGL